MNDEQNSQSANDPATQAGDAGNQPQNLGLGTNPSAQASDQPAAPDQPSEQSIDIPNEPAAETSNKPADTANDQRSDETNASEELTDTTQSIDHSQDNSAELDSIRRQALTQLSPIMHKLDLPPEERFHTMLMMIQASDDKTLIKEAFEAANQIPDETKKAEALLGIVNEINYFTKKTTDS